MADRLVSSKAEIEIISPSKTPSNIDVLPLAEWSILAATAVLLIKHLMHVNSKLIDELTDDEKNVK